MPVGTTEASAFTEIPEIDLSAWQGAPADRDALADRVRAVCHDVGFFTLVGHGVPAAFVAEYFAALQRFFALPDDVKARIDKRRSPHFRGWERVGAELTNNRPDHREQLDLSTEHPPYPPTSSPAISASTDRTSGWPTTSCPGSGPLCWSSSPVSARWPTS